MDKYEEKGQSLLKRVVLAFKWLLSFWLIVIASTFGFKTTGSILIEHGLQKAVVFNPVLVIGLPLAALISLALVLSLEQRAENIKFKALGFEFEGASGQIILWVICFVAISLSIKLFV
ncbi:hypothetical protein PN836_018760 [Ningiella sp. W23]|uniref:hypothetical protein n=1 Tax=Ningiella sp. W23 TaxID=3023715 RepID=UPI0037573308